MLCTLFFYPLCMLDLAGQVVKGLGRPGFATRDLYNYFFSFFFLFPFLFSF